jgi:WD40 repeat protein
MPWQQRWCDYYEILQIRFGANLEVVRAAYRALAAIHHPDRPTGDAEFFILINEAQEVLTDPVRRAAYDAAYRERMPGGPTASTRKPFQRLRGRFVAPDLRVQGLVQQLGLGNVSDLLFFNGQTAVIAADAGTVFIDLAQRKALAEIYCPTNGCAALTEDGAMLALARQQSVYLWDLNTGQPRDMATGHTHMGNAHHAVTAIAVTPDGRLLATGGDDAQVLLYEVSSGRLIGAFAGHGSSVSSLAFSTDGRLLLSTTGYEGVSRLFAVADQRELHRWNGAFAALSPDSRFLVSCEARMGHPICLWDAGNGRLLRQIPQQFPPKKFAFSPDGRLLGWVDHRMPATVYISEVESGYEVARFEHAQGVAGLRFSPDSQSFGVIGPQGEMSLWHLPSRRCDSIAFTFGLAGPIAWSPDSLSLAAGTRGVIVWDVSNGVAVQRIQGDDWTTAVAFSRDGSILAAAAFDDCVRAWDPHTGRQLFREKRDEMPYAVAISPTGGLLATGWADSRIRLLDLATGRNLRELVGHDGPVSRVCFSSDGQLLASSGWDKTVRLWDMQRSAQPVTLGVLAATPAALIFTPDGRELIVADVSGNVLLWDFADKQWMRRFPEQQAPNCCLALSGNGRFLAIGGTYDAKARVLEYSTGRALCEFDGHTGYVTNVEFSPDDSMLASSGLDGAVRVWRLPL